MKKLFGIILFSLVIFSPLVGLGQTSTQAKIEEVRRERDKLLAEQKRLQASLEEISKQGENLSVTVKSLDATRSKLANDLKITQNKISDANYTIDKLEEDILNNEEGIEAHRTAIRASLRKLELYDSQSGLINMITRGNLDDLWTDTFNLMHLEDGLRHEIANLHALRAELLANKNVREKEKNNLLSYSSELKGQKQAVDATRQTQAALLLATKNKESEYQKLLAQNLALQKKFEEELFRYESELKNADTTGLPSPNRGLLTWPLTEVRVTQYFGYTPEAARLYRTTAHHNGIDFRAPIGTPILAAQDGVVTDTEAVRYRKGCQYGKYVLIDHENGLSTLYGHLSSVIVTPGQIVKIGEVIGYSGQTGYATGPHLHFGLYVTAGLKIVDASSVGSGTCSGIKTVAAPLNAYLDPLAYLPTI